MKRIKDLKIEKEEKAKIILQLNNKIRDEENKKIKLKLKKIENS